MTKKAKKSGSPAKRKSARKPESKSAPPANAGIVPTLKSLDRRAAQRTKATTPNGERIWAYMKEHGIKGDYKDHVLFVGDQMLDCYGTYPVRRPEGMGTIFLVHKSRLETVLGQDLGRRFWDRRLRRRTNHGQPKTVKSNG